MATHVLVTGGAGYIGSHTCQALARNGYVPVVFDNLVYGHRDAVQWGPLVVGDIQDPLALASAFATYRPVAVIHFAAFAYVGESVTEPGKYYRNNVAGTISLLEAMRRADVSTIVFSSTCATYGVPERMPIAEDMAQRPINPYGHSKLMIEQILSDYERAHGLRSAALRYFNAAGADPEGRIGERHDPETHLIPRALMAVTGDIPHLDVFGEDYPTPDGTCLRDYIHVCDLAKGHVLALQHLLDKGRQNLGASLRLNLGTGRPTSVREIVATVEKVSGRACPVRYSPRRAGDPPALYADPAQAREILGFSADYDSIEKIVKTAWDFHIRSRA